jgi:hypothetical protein
VTVAPERLVFLDARPCAGCARLGEIERELGELRRLADDRAAEIRRLQAALETAERARGATQVSDLSLPGRRAERRLFGAVSIVDVPRAEMPR